MLFGPVDAMVQVSKPIVSLHRGSFPLNSWPPAAAAIALVLALLLGACSGKQNAGAAVESRELLVSAAISLADVLRELKGEYEARYPGVTVTYNFGASGTLQAQIEQGAPVDVFASAGEAQVNALEQKGLLLSGSRRVFAGNAAVLVVPRNARTPIAGFSDLTRPEVTWISIGNPASVPAGAYAKQILENLGVWARIQGKIVIAENVRQVLTYVEQGNADAGIVYATDAASSGGVTVVAKAPEGSSEPIAYPVAGIAGTRYPEDARAFVEMLAGPEGRTILARYSFLPPPP